MNHMINNHGYVSGSLVRWEGGLEIIASVTPSQVSNNLIGVLVSAQTMGKVKKE